MSNYPEQPKNPPKITRVAWRGGPNCDTYEVDGGYVVADKDQFWLPGVYDSHETARDAAALGWEGCNALNKLTLSEGRVITREDVERWSA